MDGVSVAATIVGLVGAAIQSTQSLIGTISSIQSVPGDVKDLRGELDSLTGVLQKVQKHLTDAPDSFEGSQHVPLAVRNCQAACDDFSALLKRWLRHSADDKIFWTDRWRIGMFGEARIKSFRDRLATDKSTLSLALQMDGLMRTIRQGYLMTEMKDALLQNLEQQAKHELALVNQRSTETRIDATRLETIQVNETGPSTADELRQLREDAQREFQHLRDAQARHERLCRDTLDRVGAARGEQKIKGAKAFDDSRVLSGYINADPSSMKQDISDLSAEKGSTVIAGVMKGVDLSNLFKK